MELKIEKGTFLSGLYLAQGIADRKSTMPILANVLLRTGGKDKLLVAATDLNVTVTAELPAKVVSDGGITLGARHLHEIVLPLRQQIVDETLKHYNAMDADPFALILARRELVEGAHQYLDSLRRYWNAMTVVTALSRGVVLETPAPGHFPPDLTEDRR